MHSPVHSELVQPTGPFSEEPLVLGRDFRGLYILDRNELQEVQLSKDRRLLVGDGNKAKVPCNALVNTVHVVTWHRRLGHMSHNKMKVISEFVNLQNNGQGFICDVCPKAKQHRLSFPVSSISSACIFELIHIDTWGPYRFKTHSGHSIS